LPPRALDISQSQSINAQFMANQDYSIDALRLLENKLAGVVDIYQYVRDNAVAAGNGILTQDELDYFVIDMKSQFDALLALANTRDAAGDFLFSGYKSQTRPFEGGITGVDYMGDQGTRTMQVSSTRFMPVSFSGTEVFENTRALDGAITTCAGTGNAGGATATTVFDPAQPQPLPGDTGRRYVVNYTGANTYTVEEYLPGNPTPQPVTPVTVSGSTISFNGIEMTVSGSPTLYDSFEVFVASKNVFQNMALFVDTLEHPGTSGVISGVAFAIGSMDFALETVSRVRAQVGSQLVELDQLKDLGGEMNLEYSDTLSRLQDVDYAEAISRLTRQKTYLEAAQQAFMKVSGLSLFNYL
jgi:flagellar hook-associated protein 3 FlgL